MTTNTQLEMRIHDVKDTLSDIKHRADELEQQMKVFANTVNDIRNDLAILKEKLGAAQ